jgi:superfamily II DNA or RNA helicase
MGRLGMGRVAAGALPARLDAATHAADWWVGPPHRRSGHGVATVRAAQSPEVSRGVHSDEVRPKPNIPFGVLRLDSRGWARHFPAMPRPSRSLSGSGLPAPSALFEAVFEREFDPGVARRGEGYLRRVRVETRSPERLVASVRGTSPYRVIVVRDGSRVTGVCSCPYALGEREPCKHLWAVLRVAEAFRWFLVGVQPGSFRVDPGLGDVLPPVESRARVLSDEENAADEIDEEEWSIARDQDDDEDEWEEEAEAASPARVERPVLGATSAWGLGRQWTWRQVLDDVLRREALPGAEAPPQTRLCYLLVPDELKNKLFYVHFALPSASALGAAASGVGRGAREDAESIAPELCAFVVPSERGRRLGQDALPIERWLSALSHSGAHALSGHAPAVRLDAALFSKAVLELCATGRCHLARRTAQITPVEFRGRSQPLRWDAHPEPWRLEFELAALPPVLPAASATNDAPADRGFSVLGWLVRGPERRPLADAEVLIGAGLVLWSDSAARFEAGEELSLALALRQAPEGLHVSEAEVEAFVHSYHGLNAPPPLRLPEALQLELVSPTPQPLLDIRRPDPAVSGVPARVTFEYAELRVELGQPGMRVLDWSKRRLLSRDAVAEQLALAQLAEQGVRGAALGGRGKGLRTGFVTLAAKKVPAVVRALLEQGWSVEAEGKTYRKAGRFALQVRTGVDWLSLSAELEFAGRAIALPALLAALKRGEPSVVLDDGSVGMLPEAWLARWGVLTGLGERDQDSLRFRKSELPLLAALLEHAPELDADAAYLELQRELERGARPEDMLPPPGLEGELRPYQREGLAFLRFLERTGFGGCLADDMGLGKTVQLLAHLATPRSEHKPSLVVAPRSVLFNWEREASRFTPGLRVLTHFGPERRPPGPHFAEYDLVLTTYALMRLDCAALVEQDFRFVVLDEAQAIKNAASHTARAARSLRADHRLALSGTPLENHVGELWSLFEFLNPGLLLHSKKLKQALTKARTFDVSSAALVARAVRPFLLRRTKAEVAPELPERTEQTLYVELSPEERRAYAELSTYYRAVIRDKMETLGVEQATPQVLEALLRLRQAACHPGLLDEKKLGDGSAKLDLLLTRLREVVDGGHKALVFSQFTSLLGIVRAQLDLQGLAYEYLDGKTSKREERVDRFQNDPELRLFLISLKAGGVGLNLTAADYVFILDPWWNPAAEAQAIDRAHRIGQTRSVMAYRLIARGTVEEKVEELQGKKRELVAAVLGDGRSLGRGLSWDDLEALLA